MLAMRFFFACPDRVSLAARGRHRRLDRASLVFGCASLLLAGCATAGFPALIDSHEVPGAYSAPRITRVRDIGQVRLPEQGAWQGASDGVAVPGELVLVEGDDFGRLPTVTIGGRAATVLARTDGGGLITQVPTGVPAGSAQVTVSQPKGRASFPLIIKRYAIVVHDGKVFTLTIDKDGAQTLGAPLSVPGARAVRLSSDGSTAYLLASGTSDGKAAATDRLVVLDLTAPGGPKLVGERALTHHARLLAAASDAPILAAIGEGKVTLFLCRHADAPAPYDAVALPKELDDPRAAELSPDGKVLALLIAAGNRLGALDVSQAPALKPITTVDLLPGERLALVRDLGFSADGETLWVVSGDNAKTLPAIQPTRLTAVRLLGNDKPAPGAGTAGASATRLLSVWRTQSVPGASAPLRLAIARGQLLASGTTIRMPPEKAAVFVSTVADAFFKLAGLELGTPAGAHAADKLWTRPQPGMMVRADVSGGGGPLFATSEIMSAIDLTPDAQRLLATAVRVSPAPATNSVVLDFGVTTAPIWGTPTPLFLPLGTVSPSELKPPFQLGDLRIQP